MNAEDISDLEKRQLHLEYIYMLSRLYRNLRGRKNAHADLKSQLTDLELHIATELKELLS